MSYRLIDIYDTKKSGEFNVTKGGNPFFSILLGDGDDVIYDTIFFTRKSFWKIEQVFEAFGEAVPEIDWAKLKDTFDPENEASAEAKKEVFAYLKKKFQPLVGSSVELTTGKDKAGYTKVFKYDPVNGAVAVEASNASPDLDEDEDVPF